MNNAMNRIPIERIVNLWLGKTTKFGFDHINYVFNLTSLLFIAMAIISIGSVSCVSQSKRVNTLDAAMKMVPDFDDHFQKNMRKRNLLPAITLQNVSLDNANNFVGKTVEFTAFNTLSIRRSGLCEQFLPEAHIIEKEADGGSADFQIGHVSAVTRNVESSQQLEVPFLEINNIELKGSQEIENSSYLAVQTELSSIYGYSNDELEDFQLCCRYEKNGCGTSVVTKAYQMKTDVYALDESNTNLTNELKVTLGAREQFASMDEAANFIANLNENSHNIFNNVLWTHIATLPIEKSKLSLEDMEVVVKYNDSLMCETGNDDEFDSVNIRFNSRSVSNAFGYNISLPPNTYVKDDKKNLLKCTPSDSKICPTEVTLPIKINTCPNGGIGYDFWDFDLYYQMTAPQGKLVTLQHETRKENIFVHAPTPNSPKLLADNFDIPTVDFNNNGQPVPHTFKATIEWPERIRNRQLHVVSHPQGDVQIFPRVIGSTEIAIQITEDKNGICSNFAPTKNISVPVTVLAIGTNAGAKEIWELPFNLYGTAQCPPKIQPQTTQPTPQNNQLSQNAISSASSSTGGSSVNSTPPGTSTMHAK